MVVKHEYQPREAAKMDGQIQTAYARKNWSSVILWNCAHPAHRVLRMGMLNRLPGRDLHAFCWLKDEEIGTLCQTWNWLVGTTAVPADIDPARIVKIAHFTLGTPDMPGYEDQEFADEWRAVLRKTEDDARDYGRENALATHRRIIQ
jgi:hypothetical protein